MMLEDYLRESKGYYREIPTPAELQDRIAAAYRSFRPETAREMRVLRWIAVSAASMFAVFVILLNSSPVFARSTHGIPVVGDIAQVFTFREDFKQDPGQTLTVREPKISGLKNNANQNQINLLIQTKVETAQKMLEERSEQEREAFFQTGGKAEDYIPAKSSITYSIKCSNNKMLSFVLDITWDRAQSSLEQVFYNLDPNTGAALTLENLLGRDYKTVVDDSIREQMEERTAQHSDWMYFTGSDGFQGIRQDQKFYVNADGKAVVVFDKYEIAPGFMGPQEFIISAVRPSSASSAG